MGLVMFSKIARNLRQNGFYADPMLMESALKSQIDPESGEPFFVSCTNRLQPVAFGHWYLPLQDY